MGSSSTLYSGNVHFCKRLLRTQEEEVREWEIRFKTKAGWKAGYPPDESCSVMITHYPTSFDPPALPCSNLLASLFLFSAPPVLYLTPAVFLPGSQLRLVRRPCSSKAHAAYYCQHTPWCLLIPLCLPFLFCILFGHHLIPAFPSLALFPVLFPQISQGSYISTKEQTHSSRATHPNKGRALSISK